jgi:hypothetical protein
MRVLVACEFSGIVREAFRKRGHDAWSCDLLPSEIPGQHIQGNAIEQLAGDWGLLIAHPPCTFLSYMGNCRAKEPGRIEKRDAAMRFFMEFVNASIPKIAVENPKGWPWRLYRRPDQIIQPYEFGHDHSKATCLWLKNLPRLFCKFTWGEYQRRWDGKRFRTFVDLTPTFDVPGGNPRSVTFQGIADAMAEQWG